MQIAVANHTSKPPPRLHLTSRVTSQQLIQVIHSMWRQKSLQHATMCRFQSMASNTVLQQHNNHPQHVVAGVAAACHVHMLYMLYDAV
jgi:late competence protein required for DNA uptake (superfamily II DNA/RNA helicase)